MSRIRKAIGQAFPSFTTVGSSVDPNSISDSQLMQDLAAYIVDQFEAKRMSDVRSAFDLADNLITEGTEAELHAATIGFLETVQNVASHRKCGSAAFEEFLGPSSKDAWLELDTVWRGKRKLAEVVAAETGASLKPKWWQFWRRRKTRSPQQLLREVQNAELRKIIEQITRE
jgi:hypothetical protein